MMRISLAVSLVSLAVLVGAIPHPGGGTIAIPLTKRSTLRNSDGTINFDTLALEAEVIASKYQKRLVNIQSNTDSIHPLTPRALGEHLASGGVPAKMVMSGTPSGPISIGTPPQTLTVLFDTGSGEFILPGIDCHTNCDGHKLYNHKDSSTWTSLDEKFEAEFAGGSHCEGDVYADTVSIAGITATHQIFGAATAYSSDFGIKTFEPDGILGLGFQAPSSIQAPPLIQTLIDEKKLDMEAFSFRLTSDGAAELYIGGANQEKYKGDFVHVPLDSEEYWEIEMDNIKVDDHEILQGKSIKAIIDTGTNLVCGAPLFIEKLYNDIGHKKSEIFDKYLIPCDKFPKLSFTFSGKSFPFQGFNLGPAWKGSKDCLAAIYEIPGLPEDEFPDTLIIGGSFLSEYYTKFDIGKSRIEFAELS